MYTCTLIITIVFVFLLQTTRFFHHLLPLLLFTCNFGNNRFNNIFKFTYTQRTTKKRQATICKYILYECEIYVFFCLAQVLCIGFLFFRIKFNFGNVFYAHCKSNKNSSWKSSSYKYFHFYCVLFNVCESKIKKSH